MSSRAYLNIFLTALASILALILILDTNKKLTTVPDRLTNISPESITSIRIIRQGEADVHLMKSSEQWYITSPIQAKASRFRINSILSLLQSPVVSQLPSDSQKLISYGLAAPDISLHLDDMEFLFGDISALDKRRFLKHDDKVFLIEDFLYPQLLQDAGFFISTELFDSPLRSIRFSCINNMGDVLELDGSDEIIMAWETLNAVSVSTIAPPMQKLANVLIETGRNDLVTFIMYMDDGDLVLKPSGDELYYRVPGNYAGDLGVPLPGCVVQDA